MDIKTKFNIDQRVIVTFRHLTKAVGVIKRIVVKVWNESDIKIEYQFHPDPFDWFKCIDVPETYIERVPQLVMCSNAITCPVNEVCSAAKPFSYTGSDVDWERCSSATAKLVPVLFKNGDIVKWYSHSGLKCEGVVEALDPYNMKNYLIQGKSVAYTVDGERLTLIKSGTNVC